MANHERYLTVDEAAKRLGINAPLLSGLAGRSPLYAPVIQNIPLDEEGQETILHVRYDRLQVRLMDLVFRGEMSLKEAALEWADRRQNRRRRPRLAAVEEWLDGRVQIQGAWETPVADVLKTWLRSRPDGDTLALNHFSRGVRDWYRAKTGRPLPIIRRRVKGLLTRFYVGLDLLSVMA